MIVGTGIDIIEISRIAVAISKQRFVDRVFTPNEQTACESRPAQTAAAYAARFAAKEAVMKALGTGLRQGRWVDVEIFSRPSGQPDVKLYGFFAAHALEQGIDMIHISLTHARDYAAAQAIAWRSS